MTIPVVPIDGYDILIIGSVDDDWIGDDIKALVDQGIVRFIDKDEDADLVKELLQQGLNDGDHVVIVGREGDDHGNTCTISQVGASVIIHCEDKIIPLTEANVGLEASSGSATPSPD